MINENSIEKFKADVEKSPQKVKEYMLHDFKTNVAMLKAKKASKTYDRMLTAQARVRNITVENYVDSYIEYFNEAITHLEHNLRAA